VLTTFRFVDRDMFMRFRGGGVGHKTTREATQSFYEDRDALDSVPFTKESERTGMFHIPGSPMNEVIDSESGNDRGDTLADADMRSISSSSEEHMDCTGSRSESDNELEEAENLQSATYEFNTDLIDGDEGSDEEADDDKDGSVLDDERSEFGYGDLEEQLLSDDSSEEEGSQDELDDAVLGAEDGEGAADTEEDYGDYAEY
jgi:hypothetical protein